MSTRPWTVAREAELLPVPYFNVMFTLPAGGRAIARSPQRVLLGAMMQTAADALMALAADRQYLGGNVGMLVVQNTWMRTLAYLRTCTASSRAAPSRLTARGGGRVASIWCRRALSVGFRARFLLRCQRLLPELVIQASVWRKPCVVYAEPTALDAHCVFRYHARYVNRAAITNARLPRVDRTSVTSRYQQDKMRGWRTMTLAGEEFLRHFLQHVLPRGFRPVRDYGFWRPQAAVLRDSLHQRLAVALPPTPHTARDEAWPVTIAAPPRHPHCRQWLVYRTRRLLHASHAPAWIDPP